MKDKKIIAVDFDGVLHSFKSGWVKTDVIPDPPVDGAIEWLLRLLSMPLIYKVVIFSARNESKKGVVAIKKWLLSNGMTKRDISALEFPTKKPACHLLIDDRCFCFKGKFPGLIELQTFKPWHGNGVW